MFNPTSAFSGITVSNLAEAVNFYGSVLGFEVEERMGGVRVQLPHGSVLWIYEKEDRQPATHTVLNFMVNNIDTAVDALMERGITFERYPDGPPQDEKGILRGLARNWGPDIAWFKDPAGNILSVLQES